MTKSSEIDVINNGDDDDEMMIIILYFYTHNLRVFSIPRYLDVYLYYDVNDIPNTIYVFYRYFA